MIGAASKRMANEFFGGLDGVLMGVPAPSAAERAAVGGEVASDQAGRVFTKPPAAPDEMKKFLTGMFVGFVLALIGVAFGRRMARNDR